MAYIAWKPVYYASETGRGERFQDDLHFKVIVSPLIRACDAYNGDLVSR